jgi:hypothetical protein
MQDLCVLSPEPQVHPDFLLSCRENSGILLGDLCGAVR